MDEAFVAGAPVVLTEREQQIFRMIAEGRTPGEIADQLYLTTATVNGAMMRVRDKLRARSTAHAVLVAERHHPDLLRGAIALHGTREGADAHRSAGTPVCWECDAADDSEGLTTRLMPFQGRLPKTGRLRRNAPAVCGTLQAARRHRYRGDLISQLTCGCREVYYEYIRDYRSRKKQGQQAA